MQFLASWRQRGVVVIDSFEHKSTGVNLVEVNILYGNGLSL